MWLQSIVIIGFLMIIVKSQSQLPTAGGGDLENVSEPWDSIPSTTPSSVSNSTKKKSSWNMIYPGTKWCGRGNKAKNEDDYGRFKSTDMCCHTHDRCPTKVKGKTTNYGITNNSSTSILSCKCDDEFYDCLKNVNTRASKTVGILYFDFVKNKCIQENPEGSGQYVLVSNTTRFSYNRFLKFFSKIVT